MCLYPRLIRNPKYTATKKNGGIIPAVLDERVMYVPIGCENCIECRKQKAREWQVRLLEDIKTNKNGIFITLTFNNESYKKLDDIVKWEIFDRMTTKKSKLWEKKKEEQLTGYEIDNEIATKGIRLFLERWRKKFKKSLRHWLVTELGHNGTENIHLHGIIWTNENIETIKQIWNYGFIWGGYTINGKNTNYVNSKTINYITKYINKIDLLHKTYKPKILTSAGIGNNYTKTLKSNYILNKFNGKDTIQTYKTETGHKIAMPTYWRNKIYSEDEREKLWLILLDKEERWIRGEKISIKNGEKDYYKALDWHRKINKQLGYGNNSKNWSRLKYERERRKIINKERLKTPAASS